MVAVVSGIAYDSSSGSSSQELDWGEEVMSIYFFPWESHHLLVSPWHLQLVLIIGALLGSVITWVRKK
ncbi:hypothetical protein J41TS4_37010 [Paenibacillus apis]|uniref:Uncharacterized protein n=1 Tax=Paenibacillus apis TaxID=1792174 RepID=A0A919Y649_9BACL|nr:hypothetical protein J41TS4_37010 [Paenibacillus apis]